MEQSEDPSPETTTEPQLFSRIGQFYWSLFQYLGGLLLVYHFSKYCATIADEALETAEVETTEELDPGNDGAEIEPQTPRPVLSPNLVDDDRDAESREVLKKSTDALLQQAMKTTSDKEKHHHASKEEEESMTWKELYTRMLGVYKNKYPNHGPAQARDSSEDEYDEEMQDLFVQEKIPIASRRRYQSKTQTGRSD